jgi:cytochrome c5
MKAIKYLPLVIALTLAACGKKEAANDTAAASAPAPAAAPASAPAPQAAPAVAATSAPVAAAEPSAADLAKGEKVFGATCQACHGTGVLGAPKVGDKAAWAPRIAQGMDTLHKNALNGIRMMPPKGGNAALKDDEIVAAVDYMASKAK